MRTNPNKATAEAQTTLTVLALKVAPYSYYVIAHSCA